MYTAHIEYPSASSHVSFTVITFTVFPRSIIELVKEHLDRLAGNKKIPDKLLPVSGRVDITVYDEAIGRIMMDDHFWYRSL